MVLQRRNFFTGKNQAILCVFFSNLFRVIGAITLLIVITTVVSACSLFNKIYCSKRKKEEYFLLNVVKSFLALFVIIFAGLLITIVASLSYLLKKTLNGQDEAEKEEKQIVAFLYSIVNLLFHPILGLFSKVYELCWTLWDMLDRR